MKRYNFELAQAFHKTDIGLDGIIRSLGGEPIPRHKETIVWYSDGSISSYEITGELKDGSIPDKENAVKVEIGTDVTSIVDYMFPYCSGLTSVTIGNRVTSIGQVSFYNCSNLSSIVIPNSVTSIGQSAFSGCYGLTSIMIGNSITSINNLVFSRCSNLLSITIPYSVTSIGNDAFSDCTALSSITSLRTSAPIIQSYAFGALTSNYTGRNTYSTGDNVLKVPQGATGYDSGVWLDPLQDATKCGFHIEYLD